MRLGPALAVAALLLLGPQPAKALDLTGAWHVLVHYRDAASARPDWVRWDDRLWVFTPEGDRLVWAEHPLAIFGDRSGRFGEDSTGRDVREDEPWRPNDAQLEEIRSGLSFNTRGSVRKSLRGSPAEGWRSASSTAGASASIISYSETWSVADPAGLPVFERSALLSSARTASMQGVTRYRTTQVLEGGNLLVGRFERDGSREGEFWITRSGTPEIVRGAGRPPERPVEALLFRQLGDVLDGEAIHAALAEAREEGDGPALRERVQEIFRDTLARELAARSNDPRTLGPQLESLSAKLTALYLDESVPLADLRARVASGAVAP